MGEPDVESTVYASQLWKPQSCDRCGTTCRDDQLILDPWKEGLGFYCHTLPFLSAVLCPIPYATGNAPELLMRL